MADPQKLDGIYITYNDIVSPETPHMTNHSRYDSTPEVVAPPGIEPYHPHPTFQATTIVNNSWSPPLSQEKDSDRQRTHILGLPIKAFWILIVTLTLLLAGGIGGGLGALAAQRNSEASASILTNPAADANNNGTPTQPSPPAGTSPAPTDGGCPGLNGTVYMPLGSDGKPILVDLAGKEQTFTRLCATDFSTGVGGGNPEIHDIVKLYLPSLEECITACAMYNARYQFKQDKGIQVAGGMCKSVTIAKKAGGYCYLKNGTAKNFIKEGEKAEDTSSALILTY